MTLTSVFAAGLAWAGAGALSIPTAVFTAETLLGLFPPRQGSPGSRRPTIAVIVPAHDEEAGIVPTLTALRRELLPGDRLCVVADNCSDRTAELARTQATDVFERNDPERRGKGYALSHALARLRERPPEVVIIVDADCTVAPGCLDSIARLAVDTRRPVQAEYLLVAPSEPSPKTRISAFAFLVRNQVRANGLLRLGLPCQLTGSGMAFAWDVIEMAEPTHDNVVEDLAMGIDLALKGHPPLFCPWAHVRSFLPASESAAKTQRRRWEGGHLRMIQAHVPRLLLKAAAGRSASCLALALDLMVPPLAFLVVTTISATGAAWALTAFGVGAGPALLLTAELGLIGIAVGAAWARYGREGLPLRQALQIPLYVAWKIPNYVATLTRRTKEGWVRTERSTLP